MKVYFISGLAADSRIFKHIQLPEGFESEYLEWINPMEHESLESYSKRLSAGINAEEPFVLLGLSMGGMVAAELAKQFKPQLTIIISGVPLSNQLPFYFKWASKWGLQKWIPIWVLKNTALTKRLFTTESQEDKKMLRQIIRESNNDFIRWAMDAILTWQNDQLPHPLLHIHGSRDELLPVRFTKPTHIIPGAGHLMVMNRADIINHFLFEQLQEIR